jgi:hypothetical protein
MHSEFASLSFPSRSSFLALCALAFASGCGSNSNGSDDGTPHASGGSSGNSTGGSAPSGGNASAGTGADFGGSSSGAPSSGGASAGSGGETSGGNAGSGGNGATGGSGPVKPPVNVLDCDSLGDVGEWQEITPPGLSLEQDLGTQMFSVDPVNAGTVYLGSGGQGIFRTTDCGANWEMVSTGANDPEICPDWGWTGLSCADMVNSGRQWTFLIDFIDSETIYTNNGYGAGSNGFFRSTNQGVDWTEITSKNDGEPNFGGNMQMSPTDPLHIFTTWHAPCKDDHGCISETTDGGETWKTHYGPNDDWPSEVRLYPLTDTNWIVPNDGIWLTTDSGGSWEKVSDSQGGGHTAGELYRASNGVFYLGTNDGILRSTDGIDWPKVDGTGPGVHRITGDGTTMWAGKHFTCFEIGENLTDLYITSPEDDGMTWTTYPSVGMNQGGTIQLDTSHHLLYSSNCRQGFWRVRTE